MKENKCASCNSYDPKLKSPHKSLLEILDRACVQCKYCKEPQKYHSLIDHEIACKKERIQMYKGGYNSNNRHSRNRLPPLNLSASKLLRNGNTGNHRNYMTAGEEYGNPFNQRLNTVSGKEDKSDNSDNANNYTISNISDN
jgi:hypothetical protein